jgi:general secretion pathway protein K
MEVSHHHRRRGAALMLSLWALFLLSAMVISWALSIDSRLSLAGYANRNLEALALACSGVEVAMCQNPPTKPDSPALVGGFGQNQRYQARITGEGGRLNFNWLVVGENPVRLEILRKYLEIKGIELNERDRMIDTLLDWVDPDNIVHLNGAEDEPGYKPANMPLKRLEELKKIKGWEEFTSASDWDADLTLATQAGGQPVQPGVQPGAPPGVQPGAQGGGINLAWASRDVILALPGMDEMRVDQFLTLRAGPDEIDGTEDDGIENMTGAEVALGSPPGQLGPIGVVYNRIDPVQRVVSVGKSGDVMRTVRVVFASGGQLKSWKEF